MSDSNKTVTQKPHCIRYLSRDLLQSLQLSVKEIVASIEHLILGQNLQQAWSCAKSGNHTAGWPVYDGDTGGGR